MLKISLFAAVIGHILCGICDCLLSYGPKGRLDLKCIKTPELMKREFSRMPPSNPMCSVILGTFSIMLFAFGYLAVSNWMYGHSKFCGTIMLISSVVFIVPIVVHHVICGFVEWFYIKMERTVEARDAVLTFQKQTVSAMIAGYFGLFAFAMTLLVGIATRRRGCLRRRRSVRERIHRQDRRQDFCCRRRKAHRDDYRFRHVRRKQGRYRRCR